MKYCESCDALGEPGTTCRECGRGIHNKKHGGQPKVVWVINEESRNYSWMVISSTKAGAEKEFRKMWRAWCKATGAEKNYWGKNCEDVGASPLPMGVGIMDGEVFSVGR